MSKKQIETELLCYTDADGNVTPVIANYKYEFSEDSDGNYVGTIYTELDGVTPVNTSGGTVGVCDKIGLEEQDVEQCDGTVTCLLYTSPSPRDATLSRMPSSA